MAVIRIKDLRKMDSKDIEEKLKQLREELIRKNVAANKSSKVRAKEIKKAIARILTIKKHKKTTKQGVK